VQFPRAKQLQRPRVGQREQLHALPLGLIESCNGRPITDYAIKSKSDLSFDEKIKYAKYLR